MPTTTCARCPAEIEKTSHNRRYCDPCRKEVRREKARKSYTPTPTGGTKDLVCETCQKVWHSRNNRGRWCPDCRAARRKDQIKTWQASNRDRINNGARERGDARRNTLRQYGLDEETYLALYEAQGGRCAICQEPHDVLCVDHCHDSDRVRGLLCRRCNRSIGQLGDTYEALQRAADYLKEAEERS